MIILNIDNSGASRPNFTDFCKALESAGLIVHQSAEAAIGVIKHPPSNVVILVSHGPPFQDEIEGYNFPEGRHIIRIGVSNRAPSLRVSEEFSKERVADFEWPNSSGVGLKELGQTIFLKLSAVERERPDEVLATIVEYFKENFMLDESIAAYLVRISCFDDDAMYEHEIVKLKLKSNEFKGKKAEDLLRLLVKRMPRTPE